MMEELLDISNDLHTMEEDSTPTLLSPAIQRNGETYEALVWRLLCTKILKLALLDCRNGSWGASQRLALKYRSVCKAWMNSIYEICFDICLPLLENKKNWHNSVPEPLLEDLAHLIQLVYPPDVVLQSAILPPVRLDISLSSPNCIFDTRFKFEATVLNFLRKMQNVLVSITVHLSNFSWTVLADGCADMNFPNLHFVDFIWDDLDASHSTESWDIVINIVKSAPNLKHARVYNLNDSVSNSMPQLAFSDSLRQVEIYGFHIPEWFSRIAHSLKNLNRLVLQTGQEGNSVTETAGFRESQLISRLAKTLQHLKLFESSPQYTQYDPMVEVPVFYFREQMVRLCTLEISFYHWRLGGIGLFKDIFPSLTDLTLYGFGAEKHFPTSWYSSSCLTLDRLSIVFVGKLFKVAIPPLPQSLLLGLPISFPNIIVLQIECDEFEGSNWQSILVTGFPHLRKLSVTCFNVANKDMFLLFAGISGSPLECLGLVKAHRTLRDMQHLCELSLNIKTSHNYMERKIDSSEMIKGTFLCMPNLQFLRLPPVFYCPLELIMHSKEKGLTVYC